MCADSSALSTRSDSGFTLIEILVALLILSIGLLGLEALGIGAARTLALSQRQSEFTTVAASGMEQLRSSVTNATAPLPNVYDSTVTFVTVSGDTAVVSRVRAPLLSGRARLTVRVVPKPGVTRRVRAQPVRLDSYLWHTMLP